MTNKHTLAESALLTICISWVGWFNLIVLYALACAGFSASTQILRTQVAVDPLECWTHQCWKFGSTRGKKCPFRTKIRNQVDLQCRRWSRGSLRQAQQRKLVCCRWICRSIKTPILESTRLPARKMPSGPSLQTNQEWAAGSWQPFRWETYGTSWGTDAWYLLGWRLSTCQILRNTTVNCVLWLNRHCLVRWLHGFRWFFGSTSNQFLMPGLGACGLGLNAQLRSFFWMLQLPQGLAESWT